MVTYIVYGVLGSGAVLFFIWAIRTYGRKKQDELVIDIHKVDKKKTQREYDILTGDIPSDDEFIDMLESELQEPRPGGKTNT